MAENGELEEYELLLAEGTTGEEEGEGKGGGEKESTGELLQLSFLECILSCVDGDSGDLGLLGLEALRSSLGVGEAMGLSCPPSDGSLPSLLVVEAAFSAFLHFARLF